MKNAICVAGLCCFILLSCSTARKKSGDLNGQERGWKSLFNGKDINDWFVKVHHHDLGVNFGNTFRVEDGIIKVRYDQYGDFSDQFAHLYYKTPFSLLQRLTTGTNG